MRIAHLMAGAPEGGAELFFERLVLALHDAGDDVLPIIRPAPGRLARLRAGGLAPATLGYAAIDPTTRLKLARLLRRFAPRVAVAWMSRAAGAAPRGDWVLAGRLGGYYDLRHYRRCDHLIGNTRGIARWLVEQGWPSSRVHYLPNFAADLGSSVPAPRAALGVPDGVPLLLALGRLHRDKAFDVLIRAMTHLPHAYALIAGEGPERGALEALARREGVAGRVLLPGWRGEIGPLLAACDVFVCPSRLEPLGNVVIEAWSAGRPVVAADSYGPAELITDGQDGLMVPMEDAAALADAIASLLADSGRAAAIAMAGRARYATAFAEAPVLAAWRDFLQTVEKA
jgi:glycosyltransferase involved in cell wall biosynthesis